MKKALTLLISIALCGALLVSCGSSAGTTDYDAAVKQLAQPSAGDTIAVFDTDKGVFKAVLFTADAPKATENFISLAKDGYYNGLPFHRVIADFIIQSGDGTGKGDGGKSVFGSPYPDEISKQLFNFTGALGVIHKKADENYSQFYIVCGGDITSQLKNQMTDGHYPDSAVTAYSKHGGRPTLDGDYTVFGQVFEGLNIIKEISYVKTDDNDMPKSDVKINTVTIETYKAPAPVAGDAGK